MDTSPFAKGKTILVVAAHPDDEVIGCGGTIARFSKTNPIDVLILGTGYASRTDGNEDVQDKIKDLGAMADKARKVLGYRNLYLESLPDNRFDQPDFLDIVKLVERHLSFIQPHTILTHQRFCLNIDHQITYRAVLTATRPQPGQTCASILSFEIASSSEWNFPEPFRPDVFVDISATVETKERALGGYLEEMRVFPHPRSYAGIRGIAGVRGQSVGLLEAEAFETIRSII